MRVLKHISFRFRPLNLIVVAGMLFLLPGTRILCDIGSSLSTDQCCSGAEEHSRDNASTQDVADSHGSSHHEDTAPSQAPADSKPDHCCSNWYVFTAESANSSLTATISSSTFSAIVGLSILSQSKSNPLNETIKRYASTANNRAPDCPLYLTLHSYRV